MTKDVRKKENFTKNSSKINPLIILLVLLIGGFLVWKFVLGGNMGSSSKNNNIMLFENLP